MHPWEEAGMRPGDDYCSLALVEVFPKGAIGEYGQLLGYVLVIEPGSQLPRYKFPGGRPDPGELPPETAARELLEETGIICPPERVIHLDTELKPVPARHWSVLFRAQVDTEEMTWMNSNHPENAGEVPKFFRTDELPGLATSDRMLIWHLRRLRKCGIMQ